MTLAHSVFRALNHPRSYWALGALASARVSARHPRVWITYDGSHWTHRYKNHRFQAYRAADHSVSAIDAQTHEFFLWGYVPSAGETIVDVGAGIGTEAPTFSACVGETGRVVAIEAHPDVYSTLVANVRANHLNNVETLHTAVGSHDGVITISDDMSADIANTTLVAGDVGIEVPCESLDSLVRQHDIGQIDLLKMNIEGAEADALRSGRNALAMTKNLAISCHDFLAETADNDRYRTKDEVWALLAAEGFKLHSRPDAQTPWGRDYIYGSR